MCHAPPLELQVKVGFTQQTSANTDGRGGGGGKTSSSGADAHADVNF